MLEIISRWALTYADNYSIMGVFNKGETKMEKTMTQFGRDCVRCGVTHTVMADAIDVAHWEQGALIQEALPYLSAGERELFISGICGACFDNMFPPDPED